MLRGLSIGLAGALDQSGIAMVLVDESGRLLHANALGERLLLDGAYLRFSFGRVTAADIRLDQVFADALHRAASSRDTSTRVSSLRLIAPTGDLTIDIVPLPVETRCVLSTHAILMTATMAVKPALPEQAKLKARFGFTPAELRLATAFCEGLTIAKAAERHGTSVNTIRRQLAGLFEKTDTSRQVDLVRLLLSVS